MMKRLGKSGTKSKHTICVEIADTGRSKIFLVWLIISRGSFRGRKEWDVQLTKSQHVHATTAIKIVSTTFTIHNCTLLLLLLFLLPLLLLWY